MESSYFRVILIHPGYPCNYPTNGCLGGETCQKSESDPEIGLLQEYHILPVVYINEFNWLTSKCLKNFRPVGLWYISLIGHIFDTICNIFAYFSIKLLQMVSFLPQLNIFPVNLTDMSLYMPVLNCMKLS